jgi:DNA mismatch repair protein MutL
MADCIHLLPDAVANQIAAGEVIQRPASIVKELVENSVDADASKITIIVSDAGKTLVQIIDDGKGMSETDARMAFERHATSKITKAEDLFAIKTKGFRGEALASIAAVATVDVKTRTKGESIGTHIRISASEVELQEAEACPEGTNFAVKNLFFNIPARRKFLKTDQTELKHIINEVQRVALAHPEIRFKLIHNNHDILDLPKGNVKQRIVNIFGRHMENNLIDVKIDTDIVRLRGYIGKPEKARKTSGEQFFFVNRRYMRHGYYFRAVASAYDRLIQDNSYPQFFIYFDIDPDKIDVNIHPTKTEIKFTDERPIYQMLHAAVKEALGKFNLVPSLDFEKDETMGIYSGPRTGFKAPDIEVNPDFNPFEEEKKSASSFQSKPNYPSDNFHKKQDDLKHWENLYPEQESAPSNQQQSIPTDERQQTQFFQLKQRYIITSVKSGMMVIDQTRAHERILYEQFVALLSNRKGIVQKSLYPVSVQLNPEDFALAMELMEKLNGLGFDLSVFGDSSFVINGLPADIVVDDPKRLIEELLENYKSQSGDIKLELDQRIAWAMSRTSARHFIRVLQAEEMQELFYRLMACKVHNFTPSGKPIISIISVEELEKRLK